MKRLLPILPLVFLNLMLEALAHSSLLPAFLFPAPSKVWSAFWDGRAEYFAAFSQTFMASLLGLLFSFIVGVILATLISLSDTIRILFYPYTVFFQTVPIIAIAPLLVIWFGYGQSTVIASAFIVSIFPIIANTVNGFLSTDPALLQLFKLFKANRLQTLIKLRIPFALPQIFAGLKISAGLAVIGAIVGEFISGTGLGGIVDTARNQQRIDRVFAAVIGASLLGLVFFAGISLLTHFYLYRWHPSANKKETTND
jgi:NitT/TauT family transport system permease protein